MAGRLVTEPMASSGAALGLHCKQFFLSRSQCFRSLLGEEVGEWGCSSNCGGVRDYHCCEWEVGLGSLRLRGRGSMDLSRKVTWQGMSGRGRNGGRRVLLDNWPTPPAPPLQYAAASAILHRWSRRMQHSPRQIQILQGLLDQDYLLALPLPLGASGFEDHNQVTNRRLRYLWRRHAATILGWTVRREEGDNDGFPAALNRALWTIVFP